jgi:hypothetical protein
MKKICLLFFLGVAAYGGLFGQIYISGHAVDQAVFSKAPTVVDCDTIFSFQVVDTGPIGLTFNGTYLCTRGSMPPSIYMYSLSGGLAGNMADPTHSSVAGDLDFDGTNYWMVAEQEANLYKIDATTGNVLTVFSLPTHGQSDPNTWGCAYDNGHIWITDYINGTLMRINAATGAVVDSFAIHRKVLPVKIIRGELYGVEFRQFGNPEPPQLVKFNRNTGAVEDSVPWCLPNSMGLAWAAGHLWGLSGGIVFGGTQRIYEFHPRIPSIGDAGTIHSRISVFPNPATDRLYILFDKPGKVKMNIYDMPGKCLLERCLGDIRTEIDLKMFGSGQYIITFAGDDWTEQAKLFKN